MAFDANDLSPHEHLVVERTRLGEVADFSAAGLDAKPAIRAGFLRKMLLGLAPDWPVRGPGVRIKGALVEGALDLTDCSGEGLPALALEACDIPEPVDVSHSRLARLSFEGSRMRRLVSVEASIDGELNLAFVRPWRDEIEALTARLRGVRVAGDLLLRGARFARATDSEDDAVFLQGADIGGNVLMDEGFDAFGCVWIAGARIGGRLQCDNSQFLNRRDDASGQALVADDVRIGGGLHLGVKAEGVVTLLGAHIGGDLHLGGAMLRNEGGLALMLNSADIGGAVFAAAKITGQVSMLATRIGGNLDLRGAEIAHPLSRDSRGVAIDAASLRIGGAALLHGVNIKGEVFMPDARIEGYLAFGGGRFINGGGWAIRAPNARVGGNLTFKIADNGYAPHGQKTVIEGGAKFDRALIEGACAWNGLELRGPGPDGAKGAVFSLADMRIGGALQARKLTAQQESRVDLSGASCATLDDDLATGWGAERMPLDLEGFAYGRLEDAGRWRQRLDWLRRARDDGRRFSPQPYNVLAAVYARGGRRDDARRVLLAQHDQRTLLASAGPLTWALSSAFGLVAGYGLAPLRVVRALIVFLALGVLGVLAMNDQGALVRPDGRACNGAVEPALYAIDVALPVIDLGQEQRCAPGRTARADLPAGIALGDSDWRLFEGGALWKWAHALYALMGAILTALAIITFSGVMKPKED